MQARRMGSWHTGIHSEGSVICTCSAEGPEQAVGPAGAPAALRGARRDELTGDWSRSAEGPLRLDAGVAVLDGFLTPAAVQVCGPPPAASPHRLA